MANIKLPKNPFLGTPDVHAFPKVQYAKIVELINKLNELSNTQYALVAKSITPPSGTKYIDLNGGVTENHTATAFNVTGSATGAQCATGLITSTSAAAVALTLPSATDLIGAIGGSTGTSFDLIVDNSGGANTVTVTASATITAGTAVLTGGATLTVASGAAGIFRIYFTSATAAKIWRLA